MEEWRAIPGLPDAEASSLGRIRTKDRIATGKRKGAVVSQLRRGVVLAPWIGRSGYLTVAIMIGGVRKKYVVHRLIGKAFVPGYADDLTINHIDGNKMSNLPSNLEWITLSDNTRHEWRTGLCNTRGEKQPNRKLSLKKVLAIRKALKLGVPANALATIAGVSQSLIALIRDGKRWAELADAP